MRNIYNRYRRRAITRARRVKKFISRMLKVMYAKIFLELGVSTRQGESHCGASNTTY
jgi:hypothetical protein